MKNLSQNDKDYLFYGFIFSLFGEIGTHHFYHKRRLLGYLYFILSLVKVFLEEFGYTELAIIPLFFLSVLIFIDMIKLLTFNITKANGDYLYCDTKWVRFIPLVCSIAFFI